MKNSIKQTLNCSTLSTSKSSPLNTWFITGFTDGEGSWGLSISKDSARKIGFGGLHTDSSSTSIILHPYFITGFSDAESYIFVTLDKQPRNKTGWNVRIGYVVGLHKKDKALLEQIKSYFGVGEIYKQGEDAHVYRVSSVKDLAVIVRHFDKYPLITQKQADYLLFKRAFEIISRKEHLTEDGLRKIVAIKGSTNKGFPDALKVAFPTTELVQRPKVDNQEVNDFNWLAGFVSGEGSFIIEIFKVKTKIGFGVKLAFRIGQHIRDAQLMRSLVSFLGCGRYYQPNGYDHGEFIVTKFSDLDKKVIPLFEKYPIVGNKAKDFSDFKKAAEIVKVKAHLTEKGLEEIRIIKGRMNGRREH
jgi:hypothetical protein